MVDVIIDSFVQEARVSVEDTTVGIQTLLHRNGSCHGVTPSEPENINQFDIETHITRVNGSSRHSTRHLRIRYDGEFRSVSKMIVWIGIFDAT